MLQVSSNLTVFLLWCLGTSCPTSLGLWKRLEINDEHPGDTSEWDDSLNSDVFSDDGDYSEPEEDREPAEGVEANDSITGLVESMIQDAHEASNPQPPMPSLSTPDTTCSRP